MSYIHISDWKKEDGYYEALLSLRSGLGPILRLRAVREGNQPHYYMPIVRDSQTGIMVASGPCMSLGRAKASSIRKAKLFIKECLHE